MKREYEAPELIVHGAVEDITQGSGWGIVDFFVYGMGDPIGNCRNGSCNTDPDPTGS
jgi:hypothetical protein